MCDSSSQVEEVTYLRAPGSEAGWGWVGGQLGIVVLLASFGGGLHLASLKDMVLVAGLRFHMHITAPLIQRSSAPVTLELFSRPTTTQSNRFPHRRLSIGSADPLASPEQPLEPRADQRS